MENTENAEIESIESIDSTESIEIDFKLYTNILDIPDIAQKFVIMIITEFNKLSDDDKLNVVNAFGINPNMDNLPYNIYHVKECVSKIRKTTIENDLICKIKMIPIEFNYAIMYAITAMFKETEKNNGIYIEQIKEIYMKNPSKIDLDGNRYDSKCNYIYSETIYINFNPHGDDDYCEYSTINAFTYP